MYHAVKIPLEKARLCLECDTIHDLPSCPQCGCDTYYYVGHWIRPQPAPQPEPAPEPPPADRGIEPPKFETLHPPRGKRRILRKIVFAGAGLLAAYGLLFRPSRRKKEPPGE